MSNRRAASLVMVLGLIAMIVAISFGVSQIVVTSIRTGAQLKNSDEAYYAAEGAIEKVLEQVKRYDVGYSDSQTGATNFTQKQIGGSQGGTTPTTIGNEATADYTIEGQLPDAPFITGAYGAVTGSCPNVTVPPNTTGGKYSFPAAGNGEAGGILCRDIEPVVDCNTLRTAPEATVEVQGQSQPNFIISDPADYPCNWGVIRAQDPVVVPLYVDRGNGIIDNPAKTMNESNGQIDTTKNGLGMSSFVMRFRTPCAIPSGSTVRPRVCAGNEREEIDDQSIDLAAIWKIEAEEWGTGNLLSLEPDSSLNPFTNTEIKSAKLNSSQDKLTSITEVALGNLNGVQNKVRYIAEYLQLISSSYETIHKPRLKLSLTKPLQNKLGEEIPYLEYQLLTDIRIANSSPIIEVEGFQNGVKQTILIQPSYEKGVLDFVVD